ncbi:hypothetical protein [Porphyromonas canoris]|uniref:hypothetical protein n=1 Tax=Porphyromonas canoris TaxID=36875 RepID=UPI00055A146E|nr:hypothetical protein [Porphyromonas canoris]
MTLIATSCFKEPTTAPDVHLIFYPRECKHILASSLQYKTEKIKGNDTWTFIDTIQDGQTEAKKFILSIMTGSDNLPLLPKYTKEKESTPLRYYEWYNFMLKKPSVNAESDLASHIIPLERQLRDDYINSLPRKRIDGKMATLLRDWNYRVTGIKSLSIKAETTLFGQPAGEELKQYFHIDRLDPKQIVSYKSKNLLWGYSDEEKITNIDQWLSMNPMASPEMRLCLRSTPPEVPTDVTFIIEMETVEGRKMKATTQIRLL